MVAHAPRLVATRRVEPAASLLLKLKRLAKLSAVSEALVLALNGGECYGAGQAIRACSTTGRPLAIASGWAAYYRLLSDGRRQIISLLLPGDHIGLGANRDAHSELSLIALTRLELINASPLQAVLCEGRAPEHDQLREALNRAEALTRCQMIDHIVRLGRQSAFERMAHLLAELQSRLETVGHVTDGRFQMPLTQEILADILGLSVVHVNRTLQQLKSQRLIQAVHGSMKILNLELLTIVSDFNDARLAE